MPSRWIGTVPILRMRFLPSTSSCSHSVLVRIVAITCSGAAVIASSSRTCFGVTLRQAPNELPFVRAASWSTISSAPPLPIHACDRLSTISTSYASTTAAWIASR